MVLTCCVHLANTASPLRIVCETGRALGVGNLEEAEEGEQGGSNAQLGGFLGCRSRRQRVSSVLPRGPHIVSHNQSHVAVFELAFFDL